MTIGERILHWLGTPFRACAASFRFLVDLSPQQMKSVLTLAMIGGMISLSAQNVWYTFIAKEALHHGEQYLPFFGLIHQQIEFNSYLIGWFALIMGLIVFGADYFRAKWGDKDLGFGKGAPAAARAVADAADNKADQITEQAKP
jgi:hypothetical protein